MPDSSPDAVEQSTEVTTPTTEVVEQVSDGNSAASSTTEKAGTMLDAVKTALEHKEESPTSEPDQKAEADPDSKATPEKSEESDELSPEELKALSQKTQGRFRSLTTKLKAKDAEIAAFKPKVDGFDAINKFVTDAGLRDEEVTYLLQLGAAIKGDKSKALAQLQPIVDALRGEVGEVLPADLQERVRLGYLTEADAKALNKAQASERLTREQAEAREAARRDADQRNEQQKLIETSVAAGEKWEAAKAEKDPDWHLKRKEVAEKVELAILKEQQKRGVPWFPNSAEIVKFSDDALKDVNARFKRFANPKAITPVAGGASTRSTPAPKSMLDVVKNAVAV